MAKKKKSQSSYVIPVVIVLFFVGIGVGIFYLLAVDKGGGKKVFVAKIDLIKPDRSEPPPPKEKLPEPEIQQKQDIVTAPVNTPDQPAGDDKPAADGPLGLEGDGGAGADGFGLAARGKVGRDITTIGTGNGLHIGDQGAILRKYAGYFRLVQEEMKKIAFKHLDEAGKFPKGKLEATVQIVMDDEGVITECRIVRSSGNSAVDKVVKESLRLARISLPPPRDVPRRINVRMTAQG